MFDIDAGKILVVGVVALLVIGPKDLPRVLRTVGQTVGKMRRMASEFQNQFMEAIKEADLEDVKKEFTAIRDQAVIDTSFDAAGLMRDEITMAVEGPKESEVPKEIGHSTIDLTGEAGAASASAKPEEVPLALPEPAAPELLLPAPAPDKIEVAPEALMPGPPPDKIEAAQEEDAGRRVAAARQGDAG
jgi:sec-independent protein translocase protein TatB